MLKRGKNMSLPECYQMEFTIAQMKDTIIRFMSQTEFFEGVRCALVDKQDKPNWIYKHVLDISR